MKYIKEYNAPLYKEIDRIQFSSTNRINMDRKNVDFFLDLLKDNKKTSTYIGSDSKYGTRYRTHVTSDYIAHVSHNGGYLQLTRNLRILELEDDYFIVEVIYPSEAKYSDYFLCDTRQGVIDCLVNITTSN